MAFSKAALCRLPAFFENLPAFSKLQGDRFAQDCTLSHAVPSLCAMVKLTYGRANRDKVSPPDTLTKNGALHAGSPRLPRYAGSRPRPLPGGIVFANRNFVLSWGDLETPRVYHAARQRGLRVHQLVIMRIKMRSLRTK